MQFSYTIGNGGNPRLLGEGNLVHLVPNILFLFHVLGEGLSEEISFVLSVQY